MKEIIVIGAGACGLMAARILAENGHRVSVIEARDRTGGRINTIRAPFSIPVEAGAEFVHGKQSITDSLLAEAGLNKRMVSGKRYQLWDGKLMKGDFFDDAWDELTERLEHLDRDTTLQRFLQEHFSGDRYQSLRRKARGFAEGYDAADINRVSAISLREEWSGSDDEHQYHIEGGYSAMIDFLEESVKKAGGQVHLSSAVSEIHWRNGKVRVVTSTNREFEAEKVIITIPLGLLQKGPVKFLPAIPAHEQAFRSMGFGGVIKLFIEFSDPFWEERIPRTLKDLAFVFSDAGIPTWWSQLPKKTPLLTGWLGGPSTFKIPDSDDHLLEEALHSLQYIFDCGVETIRSRVLNFQAASWVHDPFACGAYAYPTIDTNEALDFIKKPLADTIYFAGEAMYNGSAIGTVEAALHSGQEIAGALLQ